MFDYTYEMDLEYFASENDFELAEDDLRELYIIVPKEGSNMGDLYLYAKLRYLIDESGFDFDIEELEKYYKIY